MVAMDEDILRLYREKRITREHALLYALNPDPHGKEDLAHSA